MRNTIISIPYECVATGHTVKSLSLFSFHCFVIFAHRNQTMDDTKFLHSRTCTIIMNFVPATMFDFFENLHCGFCCIKCLATNRTLPVPPQDPLQNTLVMKCMIAIFISAPTDVLVDMKGRQADRTDQVVGTSALTFFGALQSINTFCCILETIVAFLTGRCNSFSFHAANDTTSRFGSYFESM